MPNIDKLLEKINLYRQSGKPRLDARGQYNALSMIETQGYADVKFINNRLIIKTKGYAENDPIFCRSLQVTGKHVYSKNNYGFIQKKS